jgi:ParB family transcriptional regulator, chromosome partitioning protein
VTDLTIETADPAALLVDANIRLDATPDADLVASIKAHGILVPLIVVRTTDGDGLRVRDGYRRTQAALSLGLPAVPVVVAGTDGDDTAVQVTRILTQYDVNTRRAALSTADEAGVVQSLLDLGLTAGQVQRRTRLPKAKVAAAQAAAAVPAALDAAVNYDLDLEQAAALAEFDGDEPAWSRIMAEASTGRFWHEVQRQRDHRVSQAALTARRAELEAAGVAVADKQPPHDLSLWNWQAADGSRLNENNHVTCTYRLVMLHAAITDQDGNVRISESEYCSDPKKAGHAKSSITSGGSAAPTQTTEERREVREGNKDWRSARTQRHRWLTTLLGAKKPPATAALVIARGIADVHAQGDALRRAMERGHRTARVLLGYPAPATKPQYGPWPIDVILAGIDGGSENHALITALGLILGAREEAMHDGVWRSPGPKDAEYLRLLESWGYVLSEIEERVVRRTGPADPAGDTGDDPSAPASAEGDADTEPGIGSGEGEQDGS